MASIDNATLFQVPNLIAVVTGAGSGLGRMMANALASNGAAKVYIIGRRLEKLQETASGHSNIISIQGDVTNKDSLKAIASQIQSEAGYINLLICNSGISGPSIQALKPNPSISEVQEHFWSYSSEEMNNVLR